MASTSEDGATYLWSFGLNAWYACEFAGRSLTLQEWQQYIAYKLYRLTCPNLPMPDEQID